jgi:hypothetical protein
MPSSGKLLLVALALGGCAHTASSRAGNPRRVDSPSAPKRVKLAVLPVESDVFPRVASNLNGVLHDVHVRGVDDYFLSKVTLEVVQLSIECVDATSACYAAVGRSLGAQQLLIARVVPGAVPAKPAATRGKKKRDPLQVPPRPLSVTVTLFDVEGGAAASEVERAFKSEDEAAPAMGDLVQATVDPKPRAATVSAAKAGAK